MKSLFITSLVTIFSLSISYSQDIMILKTKDSISAKVLEIGLTEIKYNKSSNPTGPIYTIPKSHVKTINYANGTSDNFSISKAADSIDAIIMSGKDLYLLGQKDASKNYKNFVAAGTGTLITSTLLTPLVGLVPAVASSSTPPNITNLNFPNATLMKQPAYFEGYMDKAKRMKKGRVWTNWGIALGINLVAGIIIFSK